MKAEEIDHVALLGAGMIGHGPALHFAKAGYQVSSYSQTQQTLDSESFLGSTLKGVNSLNCAGLT